MKSEHAGCLEAIAPVFKKAKLGSPMRRLLFCLPLFLLACADGSDDTTVDPEIDDDGDGVTADKDCDDNNPDVFPGNDELCNGVDDDCNDVIDDNYATDASVFFADDDNDGFGTADKSEAACEAPDGFITDSTDCDDADDEVYPGATEVCDRIDNDCDKGVDDDAVDRTAYYADQDEDSYGDPSAEILACEAPNKYVLNSDDCNDDDATINPDTLWYEDSDADGFGNPTRTQASCTRPADHARQADDCDDTTDRANPDATEVCDRLDNDCDTIVDDGGTGCDKWVNAYSGAYVIRAQEKIGTSVINDMRCVGNFALAVDYSQDPPAQGTVTCRQTRYTGFDSPQTGTILGEIALDGSFSGRLTHRFNSYANRTYDAAGALDADVIFEGTGTVRPNSMSAVAWQVEFSGE